MRNKLLLVGLFFMLARGNAFAQSCEEGGFYIPPQPPAGVVRVNLLASPNQIKEQSCVSKCGVNTVNQEQYGTESDGVNLSYIVDDNRSTVWKASKRAERIKIVAKNVGYIRLASLEMAIDPNVEDEWQRFVITACNAAGTNCHAINNPYDYDPAPAPAGTISGLKIFSFYATGNADGYQNWFFRNQNSPEEVKTLYVTLYQFGKKFKNDPTWYVYDGGEIAGIKLYAN